MEIINMRQVMILFRKEYSNNSNKAKLQNYDSFFYKSESNFSPFFIEQTYHCCFRRSKYFSSFLPFSFSHYLYRSCVSTIYPFLYCLLSFKIYKLTKNLSILGMLNLRNYLKSIIMQNLKSNQNLVNSRSECEKNEQKR